MTITKFFKQPKNTFAEKYRLKRLVDSNGLAEVWEATPINCHADNVVAIKIFPKLQSAGIQSLKRSYTFVANFNHDNILPATNLDIYKNQPYLEMRFCKGGNIADKISLLNEQEIIKCFCQTASALAYLHKKSIIHANIKPANILIDDSEYFCYYADLSFNNDVRQTVEKFADLSLDRMSNLNLFNNTNKARTSPACYFAPELFKGELQTSAASDIWALGATIFHVATGKLPFGFCGGEAQTSGMAMNDISSLFSENLSKTITKCLSEKAADRPTAQEIVLTLKKSVVSDRALQNEQVLADNYFRSLIKTDKLKAKRYAINEQSRALGKRIAICMLLIAVVGFFVFFTYNQSSTISTDVIKEVSAPLKIDTNSQITLKVKSSSTKIIPTKKSRQILLNKPVESTLDRHFDSIRLKVEKQLY